MSSLRETSPLPTAQVLSYVTSTSTPTRVRQIAAAGVAWMFWIYLPLFLWSARELVVFCHDWYGIFYAGVPVPIRPVHVMSDLLEASWPLIMVPAALGLLVLFARIAIRPIRRGRAWACVLAMSAVIPTAVGALVAATGFTGMAVADGLLADRTTPLSLLWLLADVPLVLIILICLDLVRFLLWIARNPFTEKTDTHFLPRPNRPPCDPATHDDVVA